MTPHDHYDYTPAQSPEEAMAAHIRQQKREDRIEMACAWFVTLTALALLVLFTRYEIMHG